MTWWQFLGACAISALSTMLGVLVAWRRGFDAGREKEFHLAVQNNVTRKMVDDCHSYDNLCKSIANRKSKRT